MNRHLRSLRLTEIDRALKLASPWLTEHASILEIGAGCGHQAAELHRRGFRVTAIDVTPCKPPDTSEFSVELYDGKHIPLTDHSVDIIFSSNTLEHIAEISEFLIELRKVLAEGGIAIHIVPSATWRFWTTLAHFPYLLFSLIRTVLPDTSKPVRTASAQNHRGVRLFRALFPHHHGEHRADDQRAAGDDPHRQGEDDPHAHVPRLRDVQGAPGRHLAAAHADDA